MMKTYKILFSFFLILISGMGLSQSVPSYVPTNGLVGWWGFNGNAQDGSGNGNHGTVNGAILSTDRYGAINHSFYFDGQNDFIGVNAVPSLLPSNLTISTWIKIPSLYTANNPIGRIIRTRFFGYILYFDSISRSIKFETFNNSFSPPVICVSSGVNYNDDLWHHIVVTFDGYLNKLMVDGILVASIPSVGPNLYYQSDGLVTIGKDGNNTHPQTAHYQGWIDDIGIWNRALTPQEITNLYNSQLPTQTSLCLPTITTSSPSSVGVDAVVIGGDISNDGGSSIVLRGVCYSTSPNPNMGNQRTEDGSGTGSFNTV